MANPIAVLIERWKADPHSTYNTWFLWEQRLKNFRSIRSGIGQVVREINAGTFGNAYRGSASTITRPDRSCSPRSGQQPRPRAER